jgi:integrase
MATDHNMLTDAKARKIKTGDKPLRVGGITGLYLRSSSTKGTGKFILRFVSPETGRRRDMGLGTYPIVSLAVARRSAMLARELIGSGLDPIEDRKREQLQFEKESNIPSFEEAARQVYEDISPAFKNYKHSQQWINTLQTYIFPKIGSIKIDQLTVRDFAEALRDIWLNKPETASRIRQRCERVMIWSIANGYIDANPISAVSALLAKQSKKRDRVQHFPSVPWRDLHNVVSDWINLKNLSCGKQALLFLILTAARSGEVRGATWDEIDFNKKVWTLPANRTKTGKVHRVPLCREAMLILELRQAFQHTGQWVFSTTGANRISDMTLTKVLKAGEISSDTPGRFATAHGFRSTFRDWASENGYSRDLAERALAHAIKSETEAAYHRTDLLEQRRKMMYTWGKFVFSAEPSDLNSDRLPKY